MAKKTTKQPNPNLEVPQKKVEEPQEKGNGSILSRLPTLLLVLAAVLTVVVLTTMEDGRHFASLRRWLVYGESGVTEDMYTYSADPDSRYGRLGDSLMVATPKTIQLLRDNGASLYELQVAMTGPSLSVGSKQAAVCDVGGESLYVLDSAGVLRTMSADRGLCYYAARMNSRDWLAVTEQKSGYKATVAVYDENGEPVFHFDSYENYVSDAAVTEDCKYLVAVSLAPQGGVFGSNILVYDLEKAECLSESAIRDGLVLDFSVTGERVVSLCDKRLTISSLTGEKLLDRAFGNLYLHDYAVTGGDFCALLLGRYQAGNVCTLTTYDLEGAELGKLELTEEVLDLSARGAYLAVLYSDSLVVYNRDLTEYARMDGTDYASHVQMGEDGSVLVIGATSAWKFLP